MTDNTAGQGPLERPVGPAAETEKPTALLDWSLYVDCPKCGGSNNLASVQHDCDHDIARNIFTNDWDKLDGWEVTCEHYNTSSRFSASNTEGAQRRR